MLQKEILTYEEYKLFCYKNGLIPLEKKKVGKFIKNENLPFTKKLKSQNLKDAFNFLKNEEGFITQESLKESIKKFSLDKESIYFLFEILEKNKITQEDLEEFL